MLDSTHFMQMYLTGKRRCGRPHRVQYIHAASGSLTESIEPVFLSVCANTQIWAIVKAKLAWWFLYSMRKSSLHLAVGTFWCARACLHLYMCKSRKESVFGTIFPKLGILLLGVPEFCVPLFYYFKQEMTNMWKWSKFRLC